MKFSCDSRNLAYAARRCSMVTRVDKTFPVSRYIKLDADDFAQELTMSATDMATSIVISVADCTVKEGGTFLADAASFTAFVSRAGSLINVHMTKAGKLVLKSDSGRLMLQPNTGVFPEMPTDIRREPPYFEMSGEALVDLMSVSIMALKDQIMSFFAGVLLARSPGKDCLVAVAAGTGKAAWAWVEDIRPPNGFRVLLPPSTPRVVPKCIDPQDTVRVYLAGKRVVFTTPFTMLVSNQLANVEKYPLAAIENMFKLEVLSSADVDVADLKEVIETAMVMTANESEEKYKHLMFRSDTDYRLFDVSTAQTSEIGEMVLSLVTKHTTGDRFEFAVNGLYMKEVIRLLENFADSNVMGSYAETSTRELITIALLEDRAKILLQNKSANALFLIAPIEHTVKVGQEDEEEVLEGV